MPRLYKWYIGGLAYIGTIIMFAYFTQSSYQSSISQPFMSLQSGTGCVPEVNTVTWNYLADTNGYWQTSANFEYVNGIYDIEQSGYEGGQAMFVNFLEQFKNATKVRQILRH